MGGAFKLDSNNIFIRSFDMTTVWIQELVLESPTSCIIKEENWKHLAIVGQNLNLDALEIFDAVIGGSKLEQLIKHLCLSRVIVNCEGFCYLKVSGLTDTSYPVDYYRLNDLFGWLRYGVRSLITTNTWCVRGDIEKGGVIVDNRTTQRSTAVSEEEVSMLREKLASVERKLKITKEKLESSNSQVAQLEMELREMEMFNSKTMTRTESVPEEKLKEVIQRRQRMLSPVRFFVCDSAFANSPQLGSPGDLLREFIAVDEDVNGLRPSRTVVHASDKYFDAKNWWFIRVEEKSKRSMLAFYGGRHNEIEAYGSKVGVPYNKGESFSSEVEFFIGLVRGIGIMFGFLY